MIKETPNPPGNRRDVSPTVNLDSKLNDAAERTLDFHFPSDCRHISATPANAQ